MEIAHEPLTVGPDQLRRRIDPATLPFQSTAEVAPLETTIGQPRAAEAITFALEVDAGGFHLYAAGAPGSGRESTVLSAVRRLARDRATPPDWVYVHNFADPDRPNAFSLPAGRGRALANDMDKFREAARREIPRAFESEDYARRRERALAELTARREELVNRLKTFARERGFALELTPSGIATVPLRDGQPIAPQAFPQLPETDRAEIEQRGKEIQEEVAAAIRQLRQLEKAAEDKVEALNREVVLFATGPLFAELRDTYADQAKALAFIDQVEKDLPGHLHDFHPSPGAEATPGVVDPAALQRQERLARYEVNVLIDNSEQTGAPVVAERNPTYYNLVGRLDYGAILGAMVTDFRQIRPGALHRANGGFLILHAVDVLRNPFSWEALKRALISAEVQIENLGEQLSVLPTARPRPQAIPLDLKVILIGPVWIYQMLHQIDETFPELFGVKADFAPDMDWTEQNLDHYAAFISRVVRDKHLRHFDRSAVARIAEHGARLRDHQRKLTTRLLDIDHLAIEASFWASKGGHDLVQAEHVDRAIAQQEYRRNLAEERTHEVIADGTLMIDTAGERVAQVNGLSIVALGDHTFGHPSRVTARVSIGRGNVQSIEREIELSGPIHSKGFLILSGYLQAQYAQEWPLALGATITFEQSYGGVEGDSASAAELYALLSALADVALKQAIAVTGSVNQHGEVQAVGGVTRKIEGFYEVCKARGLTGDQGVIVPAANLKHLMLKDEVVDAVRAGRFHVWAVRYVDEGLELLTGRTAGRRAQDGAFPEGSIHHLVEERLRRYAERAREFAGRMDGNAAITRRDTQTEPRTPVA